MYIFLGGGGDLQAALVDQAAAPLTSAIHAAVVTAKDCKPMLAGTKLL